MSDAYTQLLDAAIQHVEALRRRGVRFVPVSPQTLSALAKPRKVGFAQSAGARSAALPPTVEKPVTNPASAPRLVERPPARPAAPAPQPPPPPQELSLSVPGQNAPPAPAPTLSPEAKAAAFAELRQRVMPCVKCSHLAAARRNVVFGVGDINARLMFVGEAPGADEDAQGEPFVGAAGQLLTRIIQAMGLSRDSVYIANILKCRPDTPGQASGNRKPTAAEMQTCLPYLQEQIDLIRPDVLVALGATAVEGLLGKTIGITKLRGQWRTYRGIPLMPTYHPAYLLRNQAPSEKRRVWEDMLQVMQKLGMPISAKQQNYFLKAGG